MKIFVTGGCGFIGSHFIKRVLKEPEIKVLNMDCMTYAANYQTMKEVTEGCKERYEHVSGDISNRLLTGFYVNSFKPDVIINFAAESHVDNSIINSSKFVETNIVGTHSLLEAALHYRDKSKKNVLFVQVSTDEVYGSLQLEQNHEWIENDPYQPNSPYAASKAAADHLVRSFNKTYGLFTIITHCSNNYGPFQHSEKFIPHSIINVLQEKPIEVYGNGTNVREWIHVWDHCEALWDLIKYKEHFLFTGIVGEGVYNISDFNSLNNLDLAKWISKLMGDVEIIKVKDRPGHDLKYSLNSEKIKKEIGWHPKVIFEEGLKNTIEWYKNNKEWWLL